MKFCGKSCKNPKFFKVRGGGITSSFENQKIFLNKGGVIRRSSVYNIISNIIHVLTR